MIWLCCYVKLAKYPSTVEFLSPSERVAPSAPIWETAAFGGGETTTKKLGCRGHPCRGVSYWLALSLCLWFCSFAIETIFPLSNFTAKYIFGILMAQVKFLKLFRVPQVPQFFLNAAPCGARLAPQIFIYIYCFTAARGGGCKKVTPKAPLLRRAREIPRWASVSQVLLEWNRYHSVYQPGKPGEPGNLREFYKFSGKMKKWSKYLQMTLRRYQVVKMIQ